MEAFFPSTLGVVVAEISDKMQLLALSLTTRPAHKNVIVAGISIVTPLNHPVSAALGVWPASAISPEIMRWVVDDSFIAARLWLLLPGKDEGSDSKWLEYGAFTAAVVLFFLVEIDDKAQIAVVLLTVKYQSILLVMTGSVAGLMTASVSTVYLGEMLIHKIPTKAVRIAVCILFCLLGILTLLDDGIMLKAI